MHLLRSYHPNDYCGKFMTILRALYYRIRNVGHVPICNMRRDHAPCVGSFCFPLCWRCTAIILAFLVTHKVLSGSTAIEVPWFILMLLCTPASLDGICQYVFKIESTNFTRIWTGALAGFGIGFLIP